MGLFRKKSPKGGGAPDPRALAMAEVLGAELSTATLTLGNDKIVANTPLRWTVRLQVEPEGSAPFEASGRLNTPQGTELWVGLRIPVRYDPADPTSFELAVSGGADGIAMMVQDEAGPINVAGMDLSTLMNSALQDPKGLKAQLKGWQQDQQSAAESQMASIMGQAQQMQQAALQQVAQAQPTGGDLASQLVQLDQLHQSGALSAEEFAAAKARLLGS